MVLVAAFAAAVVLLSGATLTEDGSALARVKTQLFAGRIASVHAFAPDGTLLTEVVWVEKFAAGSSSRSVCSAA